MVQLKVTYDAQADAAYIYLTDDPATRSAHTYLCDPNGVDGMINLDFGADGRLLGVEVLGASEKLSAHLLNAAERLDVVDS
ncbi:uncharacterized protein YuzE [Stackebrandtia albiflava]|uniref:Uncharacterized protein YuzE n=1 Tax=Stackebrandtia albiflava TaxID=406432 RepID=A0A562UQ93_9ACTN|nr:DUF2283 domain-containing protein [Stackebrandtia albiflava]TWJ07776.1 uncharacterized protein YuzE [Stackebrandtia albiflava]